MLEQEQLFIYKYLYQRCLKQRKHAYHEISLPRVIVQPDQSFRSLLYTYEYRAQGYYVSVSFYESDGCHTQ